jgi:hypothetical protein
MAVKTFTDNTSLPASDINTYLANSGLVYVSTTTFSGATAAQFQTCFNSTYTNYRALVTITSGSANATYLRFLVGSTVQTGNILSINIGAQISGGATVSASNRSDSFGLMPATYPTYPSTYSIDFFSPEATGYTSYNLQTGVLGTSVSDSIIAMVGGRNIATTQINGFELTTAGATNLAGTMTLYGYRKA